MHLTSPPAPWGCQERRPSLVSIEGRAAKHIHVHQPLISVSLEAELGDASSPGKMEILVGSTQPSHCQFHASRTPLFPHDEGSISMSLFPLVCVECYPGSFQTTQSLPFLPSLQQGLPLAILVLAEANLKFISSDSLGACSVSGPVLSVGM